MSVPPDKTAVAELLAPPVESIIAKSRHEDFPWSRGLLATHLPLDPTTLEVLCRVNLPKMVVRRGYNSDETFFTDHGLERTIKLTCLPLNRSKPEQSPARLSVTIRQCNSYLNAVKTLRDALWAKGRSGWTEYGSARCRLGNYSLENQKGTGFIWVRLTTVVELLYTNYSRQANGK